MAMIPQKPLFTWENLDALDDLHRLRLVLEAMPDEALMRLLERARGRGRDDYPVRAVWNSLLAGIVYQHPSIESLRRELGRNAPLRQACGFDLLKGVSAVPTPRAYTTFLENLMEHQDEIDALFDDLVERLGEALPGFGRVLAADGKAVRTHARPRGKDAPPLAPDGRRDTDADFGTKTYRGTREDGTPWEKIQHWFGYKVHLVVDAEQELPVAYEVTRASASEMPQARRLLGGLTARHPDLVAGCEFWTSDKGQDDGKLIRRLWDDHEIKPAIDIRAMWKEPDETRVVPGTWNVVYDQQGTVYCHCPVTGCRRKMAYGGFEKDRETLKYRCPAVHYGLDCAGRSRCGVRGSVRIPMTLDRRLFTPLARSSYAWKRVYAKRSAVERVNSRLDGSFGLERHFIRGQRKMGLRVGLALVVMLAMALGRVRENQPGKVRSLVGAA
ncbi:MAG: transposase [Planctomycetota bacterium]|nr:transposase [Planctomycetota bacterium]